MTNVNSSNSEEMGILEVYKIPEVHGPNPSNPYAYAEWGAPDYFKVVAFYNDMSQHYDADRKDDGMGQIFPLLHHPVTVDTYYGGYLGAAVAYDIIHNTAGMALDYAGLHKTSLVTHMAASTVGGAVGAVVGFAGGLVHEAAYLFGEATDWFHI
ncbi:MAG: hypothetical protein J0G32_01330 [Alphaproteobacteria bacterium]|nr:hypothetical protein [Alphaproteobacteria bacterium]OJV13191.1 MAG: hypothetical protein BGO27_00100 [Alphaproteobacteria bacterium 33-17]